MSRSWWGRANGFYWRIVAGWFIISLAACASQMTTEVPTRTSAGSLTPYVTPSPSTTPTYSVPEVETPPPLPSPTPLTHTVVSGETLIGIATRYGTTLQALLIANPNIDPQFLPVGAELVIPLGEEQASLPEPTPIPLLVRKPVCYPTLDEGQWCFVLVENNQEQAVENISVRFLLRDIEGNLLTEASAFGLLNKVDAGLAMPIGVYFSPPVAKQVFPEGYLLTALPVPTEDERYLPLKIAIEKRSVSDDGLFAQVEGSLSLGEEDTSAETIWLLAVAYDSQGYVVGFRRWEAPQGLDPGEQIRFTIGVYSLGGVIGRVELLGEARR
jgi:LysM repeat protein